MRELCFNTSYVSVQANAISINESESVSIHPMCRFKLVQEDSFWGLFRFQYILCVGSSSNGVESIVSLPCFNTSYVSVQEAILSGVDAVDNSFNTSYVSVQGRLQRRKILNVRVSIHPMCRFKTSQYKSLSTL